MAQNTIDSLQIQIAANANVAVSSLNKLSESLLRLKTSLGGISNGQFQDLSSGIRQMSEAMQRFSGTVKTADFTRIATGLNKLSSVNVQGVSNAARAINTLTANLSQIGTISFDSQGIANIANAISKLGRKTVSQAAANIPLLTQSLQGLVIGLNRLGAITFDVSSLSTLVSAITRLGGKSATNAASGNIERLAIALRNMMATLSTAPRVSQNVIQMAQALAQLAANGTRAGTAARGLASNLNVYTNSSKKATLSTFSLAAAIGRFYATYWLLLRVFRQLKKAMDISSDLTEVQNVVDVTFQDMSDKVEELSSRSIEDFGMSELTTKTIASRFQAMGTAMSIDKGLIKNANQYLSDQTRGYVELSDSMADVSLTLTKLTADMASFYNMNQKDVAEDLESIFTGQTRPLRTYGLDLTQATLQEWAMKQGMDVNIRTMSQAEKTMLRYQYVLANTGAAQGDFARTSNTWANQTRILVQNFEQLGAVIGGVLINAFKPFVQALNSVMGSIINFAQVVSDALGAIFGWTYQTGGGVTQDFELAAGAAEDLEDATGGAAKNAKELNKYIAPWHEVNNMTTDQGSKGGGGSGVGGSDGLLANADGGKWVKGESLWEKYTSDIDSLYELGSYISNVLTQSMNDINWESVYQSASNFGQGLALFLNGLITPELFGALGTTIAGSLNTVLHGLDSFGETFDWVNFGESIATGINDFFSTFDFGLLADTLNTWAKGLLDALIAGLEEVDWNNVGIQIGTFLEGIDFLEIGKKVAKAIWEALNSGFDLYKGMFKVAPVESAILGIVGLTKLLKTNNIKKFAKALEIAVTVVKNFGGALVGVPTSVAALQTAFPALAGAIGTLTTSFRAFVYYGKGGQWARGFLVGIENITRNLTGIQKGVITAVSAFAEFNMINTSVSNLVTGTGNLYTNLIELASGAAIGAAGMYVALGPTGLVMAAITGVVAGLTAVRDSIREIDAKNAAQDIANALSNPGGISIEELSEGFSKSIEEISDGFDELSEKAKGVDSANESIEDTWREIEKIEKAMDNGVISVEEGTAKLSQLFGTLASTAEQKFGSLETTLLSAFGENGVLSGVYDRLGVTTEETMKTVLQVNDTALQRIEELTTKLATMDPTNPNYATLKTELYDLLGTTDELSKSISDYEFKINNTQIDYSGLLAEDGNLDSSALITFLDSITTSVSTADTDIENGILSIKTSLTEELNTALSLGDTKSAEEIQAQLDALPQAMGLLEGDIKEKALTVSNALQIDFLGKIDEEIEAAKQRWSEMSWWEQLLSGFSSEDEYVQNAVTNFKTNYIDPLSTEIEKAYGELGIEGAGFASTAAQDIIDSLFSTTVTASAGGGYVSTDLNENYKKIVQDSLSPLVEQIDPDIKNTTDGWANSFINHSGDKKDEIKEAFKGYAAYSEQGFREKIEELSETSTPKVMEQWALTGVMNPFALKLGINSPSTIFKDYGKNTVEGFNQGIENNQASSEGVIGAWVSKISGWFTGLLGIESPSKVFSQFAKYTVEGFNQGISRNTDSTQKVMSDWANGISGNFKIKTPVLDLSVDTSKYQVQPPKINPAEISGQVQEAVKYAFTVGGLIDYNRLGEAVYQGQSQAMQENPVQIGDKDIYSATKRQQQREWRRTHRVGWAGID